MRDLPLPVAEPHPHRADGLGPLFVTAGLPGVDRPPVGVSYGMGVDSTALLLGLLEMELFPDAILTADTGGELPSTYHYLFAFDRFLAAHGFARRGSVWRRPPGYDDPGFGLPIEHRLAVIVCVANDGRYGTLEKNCRDKAMVPSLAYGGRSCSEKYKHRPMHKWCKNHWEAARLWWGLNGRNQKTTDRNVVKLIGYDAGEVRRSDILGDGFYTYRYPLREWGWGRPAALEVIARHGLSAPGKSSCFYCPAAKKPEIVQLGLRYPGLLRRALDMEQAALDAGNLKKIKGLARSWAWNDFVKDQCANGAFQQVTLPMSLGCVCQPEVYAGEGADADDEECQPEETP